MGIAQDVFEYVLNRLRFLGFEGNDEQEIMDALEKTVLLKTEDYLPDWKEKDPCALIHEIGAEFGLDDIDHWEDEEYAISLLSDFIKVHCDPTEFNAYLRDEAANDQETMDMDHDCSHYDTKPGDACPYCGEVLEEEEDDD